MWEYKNTVYLYYSCNMKNKINAERSNWLPIFTNIYVVVNFVSQVIFIFLLFRLH